MPASSKTALEKKRIANMNRARVRAVKNFLNKPWVRQSLAEAVKEYKEQSRKTLCDALAVASTRNSARFNDLVEKSKAFNRTLHKASMQPKEQKDELRQLQDANKQLAKENGNHEKRQQDLQAELDEARAALTTFRSKQARLNYWARPQETKRWAWLTLDPKKWVSRGNSSLRDGCMGMQ